MQSYTVLIIFVNHIIHHLVNLAMELAYIRVKSGDIPYHSESVYFEWVKFFSIWAPLWFPVQLKNFLRDFDDPDQTTIITVDQTTNFFNSCIIHLTFVIKLGQTTIFIVIVMIFATVLESVS